MILRLRTLSAEAIFYELAEMEAGSGGRECVGGGDLSGSHAIADIPNRLDFYILDLEDKLYTCTK